MEREAEPAPEEVDGIAGQLSFGHRATLTAAYNAPGRRVRRELPVSGGTTNLAKVYTYGLDDSSTGAARELTGLCLHDLDLERERLHVQQMLGHARLNTPEIYTRVNIQRLIEVHRLTHPAQLPPAQPAQADLSRGEQNRTGSNVARLKHVDGITFNPKQCGGRPCIRGMRIRVKDVLDLLAAGVPESEILADFPYLQPEDLPIWRYAVENQTILITKDEDFAERIRQSRTAPVVVWLRVGNVSNRALRQWFMPRLPQVIAWIEQGTRVVQIR